MDKMMIGTFSKTAGVSKRMLRHYDKTGLVTPIYTDPINDYRYYSHDQIGLIHVIKQLQDFGFTLTEIKTILDTDIDKATFMDLMKDKEATLRTAIDEQVSQLIEIKRSIAYLSNELEDDATVSLLSLPLERSQKMTTHPLEAAKSKLRALPNQAMFDEQIEEFMSQSKSVPMYYLTFDIDEFAAINDTYGFDVGDLIIYQVYATIDQHFHDLVDGQKGYISRLGGDEFALFIHDTSEKDITDRVDCTIKAIHDFDFSIHGCDRTITESCGICKVIKTNDPRALRHTSVKAMIEAKRNGRNQWCILSI